MPAFLGRTLSTSGPAPPVPVRATGSTRMLFISDRSRTIPSLHVPFPAMLCAPPRTAMGSWCSRPKLTPAMTSTALRHRTMTAGLLSIMAFQTRRPCSYPGSSDVMSDPRWVLRSSSISASWIAIRRFSRLPGCRSDLHEVGPVAALVDSGSKLFVCQVRAFHEVRAQLLGVHPHGLKRGPQRVRVRSSRPVFVARFTGEREEGNVVAGVGASGTPVGTGRAGRAAGSLLPDEASGPRSVRTPPVGPDAL